MNENQKENQHCVMWQQLDEVGSEFCALRYQDPHWFLNGTVITRFHHQPSLVTYQVQCDDAWRTQHVALMMQLGRQHQTLTLTRDAQATWHINGSAQESLSQCVDVDLGITPATNTLPIRRLNLDVGESAEVFAAWVRFPQLSVEVLAQRYTRLSDKRYQYESRGGAFKTEIEVDNWGVVTNYPDLWKRVGTYSSN